MRKYGLNVPIDPPRQHFLEYSCCNDCSKSAKCATGYACWDYITFVRKGKVVNDDRRLSKEIYTKLVDPKAKEIFNCTIENITDFEEELVMPQERAKGKFNSPEDLKIEVLRLYRGGAILKAISLECGVVTSVVHEIVTAAGLPNKRQINVIRSKIQVLEKKLNTLLQK